MGQYKSFQENQLANRLVKVEQELLKLKAIQPYDPQQINYSYQSNTLMINSYRIAPSNPNDLHYGILATLIFTSWFPNIFPRVSFSFSGNAVLVSTRTEYLSKNQTRLMIYFLDSVVPMDIPHQFNISCFVKSNVSGTLKLEQTYVRPE